ncbi:MAG TPA: hypothetical protein VN914_16555 [Polyangia bacterium]|nr:hypothetical protein [Polyangia bacterium]
MIALLLAVVLAQSAPEVPEGNTGAAPAALESTVNGYLDERLTLQRVRTDGLIPGDTFPRFINLTEANFQLKLRWGGRGLALGDASFFYQRAAFFPGEEKDLPAYRPLAVISELYGSYSFTDHANVTLGKKRVVWGPGLVLNPTDLLNPPKDPTDPSLQRAGAWLARVELPFERFTLTFVGAARALREAGGVPTALAVWPGSTPRDPEYDDQVHAAAVARLYLLLADSDLNVEYFFTNLYNDAFRNKSRLGLSFSRLVGKALEVHLEALGQLGSARLFVDECVNAPQFCGPDIVSRSKLDSHRRNVHALLGARYTFGDDALLGADYAYYSDGYDAAEWRNVLVALRLARAAGVPPPLFAPSSGGTPQRFTFEPLRRHYLFLYYMKPHLHDDFTINVTLITGLADLSAQLSPQLVWSVRDWLSLTLQLFSPIPAANPTEVGGEQYGELTLLPIDYRAVASARFFY